MFVSFRKRFAFVAIPKTGSRSMYRWLRRHFRGRHYGMYHSFILPEEAEKGGWCVYLTVRNPYERAFSHWNNATLRGGKGEKGLDFPEWIEWRTRCREDNHAAAMTGDGGWSTVLNQHEYIDAVRPTHILQVENFPHCLMDLPFVKREQVKEFPWLRKTEGKKAPSFWDIAKPSWVEAVNEFCAGDFEHPALGKMYDRFDL